MGSDRERRAYARHGVDAVVRIRVAGSTGAGAPCRLADASRGGVAVMTTQEPQGERIRVEILNSEGEPIGDALDAEIVYVEDLGQVGYRIGCRFDAPGTMRAHEDR